MVDSDYDYGDYEDGDPSFPAGLGDFPDDMVDGDNTSSAPPPPTSGGGDPGSDGGGGDPTDPQGEWLWLT